MKNNKTIAAAIALALSACGGAIDPPTAKIVMPPPVLCSSAIPTNCIAWGK